MSAESPLDNPAHESSSEWQYRLMRSAGIGTLAMSLVTGFVVTDAASGVLRWHDNTSKISLLDQEYVRHTNKASVIFAGWGQKDGKRIAEALDPVFSLIGPQFYASYPDDGLHYPGTYVKMADQLTEQLAKYGANTLIIDTQSMGSDTFMKTLRFMPENIDIELLILDCSPPSIAETLQGNLVENIKFLEHYPRWGLLTVVPLTVGYTTFVRKNNDFSTVKQVSEGVRIGFTGTSPELMKSEALAIVGPPAVNDYISKRLENTKVIMTVPDNLENDNVVDLPAAHTRWEKLLGKEILMVPVKNGEHASPTTRPGEYVQALGPILAQK